MNDMTESTYRDVTRRNTLGEIIRVGSAVARIDNFGGRSNGTVLRFDKPNARRAEIRWSTPRTVDWASVDILRLT